MAQQKNLPWQWTTLWHRVSLSDRQLQEERRRRRRSHGFTDLHTKSSYTWLPGGRLKLLQRACFCLAANWQRIHIWWSANRDQWCLALSAWSFIQCQELRRWLRASVCGLVRGLTFSVCRAPSLTHHLLFPHFFFFLLHADCIKKKGHWV